MIKRHSVCSSKDDSLSTNDLSWCRRPAARFIASCLVVGTASLASAPRAYAQSATGFALNRHEPAERGSEWFVTDSLDFRGKNRLSLGATGDYSYRPLVIHEANGDVRSAIVSDQLVLHLGASLVLAERIRLGLNLPLQMYADGEGGTLNGVTYPPPSAGQSVGDIRLAADARLLGEYGDAATLAIGVRGWIPNGASTTYASDGELRLSPQVLLAGDISRFTYAARSGFLFRSRSGTFGNTAIGSEIVYGVSAGVRALEKKNLVIGPELFGSTVTDDFFGKHTSPVEALLGAHYSPGDDWRIGAGGGLGLGVGFGSPVARALATIEWSPRPTAAAPPPKDSDGDGIFDEVDACPNTPGVRSDDPQKNGCPAPKDADGDGILDEQDACPAVAGPRTDDPRTTGCPDSDKDGIIDRDDACPKEPGVKSAEPSKNGCPVDPDRDKDGVLNENDACPDQAGKPDPDPKKNGCPIAFIEAGKIELVEQVRFATGRTEIVKGKESEDVLQAILAIVKAHPEIKKIRVEGHTDNQGAAALNEKLSAGRAASVVDWLVKHGIDKARLSSAGFGMKKPIADNGTEEGRKLNRRVEFHIEEAP